MKSNRFIAFTIFLIGLLAIAFIAHYSYLGIEFRNELLLTYSFNFIVCIAFLVLFLWKEKVLKPYLGYYFLYFSLFKFILFLTLIRPLIDATGGVKGHAFLSFFIPYTLCLVQEIRFVIKELNTSN
jgi:hypothetical protein